MTKSVRVRWPPQLQNSTALFSSNFTPLPLPSPSSSLPNPGLAHTRGDIQLTFEKPSPAGFTPSHYLTSSLSTRRWQRLSGLASGNIIPTGTARTKPQFPSSNTTQSGPHSTGFPLHGGDQGVLHTNCSGTYTIGPYTWETVTKTITEIVGTSTITYGANTPSAVFISPLPFCTTTNLCSYNDICDAANSLLELPITTVLVTKKTPAISYTPETVGPIFQASVTAAPAQHLPLQLPDPGLQRSIPSAISTESSQGNSPDPVIFAPTNIGQLPGSLPNLYGSPGSGSSGSGLPSALGGSSPHNGNAGTGSSAVPGQADPGSGIQGSENGSPVNGGNPDSGGSTNPIFSGSSLNDGGHSPAVITNGGTTSLNDLHVSIVPHGVAVGSQTFYPSAGSTTVKVEGQVITIEPSRIIAGKSMLPFSIASDPLVTSLAIGGFPVVVHPNDAVIASETYSLGSSPTAIVHDGQTYVLGSSKLVATHTTVNLPQQNPALGLVTAGGEVFSVYPSQLEAPGITVAIPQNPQPSIFAHRGETFTLNPSQVIVPDRTIPLPSEISMITPAPSLVNAEGITMYLGPSEVIIGSRTYSFETPTSIVYNDQTISLGPSGVGLASTTIAIRTKPEFSTVTEGALTLIISPSEAIIGGRTFDVMPDAKPTSTIINGQSIIVGPQGITFVGTTAILPRLTQAPYVTVVDGLIFSLEASNVVISGTTYEVGSGAKPTTITVAGDAISIGPEGVGLQNTTIVPPSTTVDFAHASDSTLSPATPSTSREPSLENNDFLGASSMNSLPSKYTLLLSTLGLSAWAVLV